MRSISTNATLLCSLLLAVLCVSVLSTEGQHLRHLQDGGNGGTDFNRQAELAVSEELMEKEDKVMRKKYNKIKQEEAALKKQEQKDANYEQKIKQETKLINDEIKQVNAKGKALSEEEAKLNKEKQAMAKTKAKVTPKPTELNSKVNKLSATTKGQDNSTASGGSSVVLIVCLCVGAVVLTVGSIFAVRAYQRKSDEIYFDTKVNTPTPTRVSTAHHQVF